VPGLLVRVVALPRRAGDSHSKKAAELVL
jgi:hypothetical protein